MLVVAGLDVAQPTDPLDDHDRCVGPLDQLVGRHGARGSFASSGDDQRPVADIADRGGEAEPVPTGRARSGGPDLEVPWDLLVEVREPSGVGRDRGAVRRGNERRPAQGDGADRRDDTPDQALSRRRIPRRHLRCTRCSVAPRRGRRGSHTAACRTRACPSRAPAGALSRPARRGTRLPPPQVPCWVTPIV